MEIPPPHVLAQLDAIIVGQSSAASDGGGSGARATSSPEVLEDDDDRSISSDAFGIESSATSFSEPVEDDSGGARATSSRFWGVSWNRRKKKWQARYRDANGKKRRLGYFDDDEEAARTYDQAIRDAGLEGRRKTNAVNATGALVTKPQKTTAVPPEPARDPTETTSKYWGVHWDKRERRWKAQYKDANGKQRSIGRFDTQEAAARAYNAAIRRAGLQGKRRTNAVVDGRLVPKPPGPHNKKRRRVEPAASAPSTRQRN